MTPEPSKNSRQNNDDVLGFLAVLRLSDVNRTMNGADLSCSAHFGVASLSLEVTLREHSITGWSNWILHRKLKYY